MAYDLCWLGNVFKLLSGFSGTKFPKKRQGNRSNVENNMRLLATRNRLKGKRAWTLRPLPRRVRPAACRDIAGT